MKKSKKKSDKPFAEYSAFTPFYCMPFSKVSQKAVLHLFKSIFKNFFLIQTKQKLHISDLPVVHVDHSLDKTIPFTPRKVKIYLDFVWFFCRIISMLIKRLGKEKALPLCAEFIDFIAALYDKGGSVYSTTLTTTDRPFYIGRLKFIIIHLFDPHFLCVPSLHVAIVAGTYGFIRSLLEKTDLIETEKDDILKQCHYGAVKITESVLYVKQHSINCVGGALYMLTAAHKNGLFTEQDAEEFVSQLFNDAPDIFPQDVQEIRSYILEMYKGLLEDCGKSQIWQQALFNFLKNYKK